jgi:hypothetical protein
VEKRKKIMKIIELINTGSMSNQAFAIALLIKDYSFSTLNEKELEILTSRLNDFRHELLLIRFISDYGNRYKLQLITERLESFLNSKRK